MQTAMLRLKEPNFQGVGKTYDEQGNSIELHEFVKAYPAIVNEVQHMATNVLYDESLK